MVKLIDEADLGTAHARAFTVAELDAIDAVDHHGAGVGAFEQSRDMEQSGLTCAGQTSRATASPG